MISKQSCTVVLFVATIFMHIVLISFYTSDFNVGERRGTMFPFLDIAIYL